LSNAIKKSNTLSGRLRPKEGVLSDHGVPYTLGALLKKRNVPPNDNRSLARRVDPHSHSAEYKYKDRC